MTLSHFVREINCRQVCTMPSDYIDSFVVKPNSHLAILHYHNILVNLHMTWLSKMNHLSLKLIQRYKHKVQNSCSVFVDHKARLK